MKVIFEKALNRDISTIEASEYTIPNKCKKKAQALLSAQYDLSVKEENGVFTLTLTPLVKAMEHISGEIQEKEDKEKV